MKVKSILKLSCATKVNIIEVVNPGDDEILIDHDIDLIRHKMGVVKINDTWY